MLAFVGPVRYTVIMLELRGISKGFRPKKPHVLRDISFSIQPGETVALVGENGAGKSTLIRILSQILKPDSGTVFLDGVSMSDNPVYLKSRTGTLFSGESSLYDRLTARENIIYHARLNGIPEPHYTEHLERLIEELALFAYIDDRVATFSRGMKQRTAIARTLITDPDFVILDEPSTGLDILAMESVKRIISGLGTRGKTVLFSSHFTDEILGCADRVVIVHDGTIACDSPVGAFRPEGGKNFTDYLRTT